MVKVRLFCWWCCVCCIVLLTLHIFILFSMSPPWPQQNCPLWDDFFIFLIELNFEFNWTKNVTCDTMLLVGILFVCLFCFVWTWRLFLTNYKHCPFNVLWFWWLKALFLNMLLPMAMQTSYRFLKTLIRWRLLLLLLYFLAKLTLLTKFSKSISTEHEFG